MVYEFLYRGPTPDNGNKPAWHVVLAESVTAFGKTELRTLGPLTPEQSEKRGYLLADIVAEINAAALASRDVLAADLERKNAENVALAENLKKKTAEHAAAVAARDMLAAELKTTSAKLATVESVLGAAAGR